VATLQETVADLRRRLAEVSSSHQKQQAADRKEHEAELRRLHERIQELIRMLQAARGDGRDVRTVVVHHPPAPAPVSPKRPATPEQEEEEEELAPVVREPIRAQAAAATEAVPPPMLSIDPDRFF